MASVFFSGESRGCYLWIAPTKARVRQRQLILNLQNGRWLTGEMYKNKRGALVWGALLATVGLLTIRLPTEKGQHNFMSFSQSLI